MNTPNEISRVLNNTHQVYVAALWLDRDAMDALSSGVGSRLVGRVASADKIVAARILRVAKETMLMTTDDNALPGDNDAFDGLFIIEGVDDAMVQAAAAIVRGEICEAAIGEASQVRFFTQISSKANARVS